MRTIQTLALAALVALTPTVLTAGVYGTTTATSSEPPSRFQPSPARTSRSVPTTTTPAARVATSPFSPAQHRQAVRWFQAHVKPEYLNYLRARDRRDVRAMRTAELRLGRAMTSSEARAGGQSGTSPAMLFRFEVFQAAGAFVVRPFTSAYLGYSRLSIRGGRYRHTHSMTTEQARANLTNKMRALDRGLRRWIEQYSGRRIS